MHRGHSVRGHGTSQSGLSFPQSSSHCRLPWQSPLYPQPLLSLDMTPPPEPSPPRRWLSSRKPSRAASPWSQWSGPIRASCELSLGGRERGELGAGAGSQEREAQGNPRAPRAVCAPCLCGHTAWVLSCRSWGAGSPGLGQNLRRAGCGNFRAGKVSGPAPRARSYDRSLNEAEQQDSGPGPAALQGLLGPPHLGNRPEGTWEPRGGG